MRAHLDKGFDIPHVIVSDGSLTPFDIKGLAALPNVIVEEKPIDILIGSDGNPVPKAPLLGKLQCHKRCFDNHGADRAVLFDCDIFFFKNWEADLRKILTERAVVLRDWGSSLGTNGPKYRELFGVFEDATTPNCNTGVIGINKEDYHLVEDKIKLHQSDTFMMMEDQGAMFAAFYGNLSYANGIKCVIMGAETHGGLWPYFLKQNAIHLMGMREREKGLRDTVSQALAGLPDSLPLKQFTPIEKHISFGRLEYDHYNFNAQFQLIPSSANGVYLNDAMYLHGGSNVKWKFPPRCNSFKAKFVCMDTGIVDNVKPVTINNKRFNLNDEIDVPLNGELRIATQDGPGTHLAFKNPRIEIDKTTLPDLSEQLKHSVRH